uniref:Hemoglobin linker chain n=1 Tax=Ditylenchus dipsaci TaxID=166011 RepID=A0A915E9W5_9BILA
MSHQRSYKKVLRDLDLHTAVIPGVHKVCSGFGTSAGMLSQAIEVTNELDQQRRPDDLHDWRQSEGSFDGSVLGLDRARLGCSTKNQVIISFKVCGLTNAGDGSEDDFIHCFKAHGLSRKLFVALHSFFLLFVQVFAKNQTDYDEDHPFPSHVGHGPEVNECREGECPLKDQDSCTADACNDYPPRKCHRHQDCLAGERCHKFGFLYFIKRCVELSAKN